VQCPGFAVISAIRVRHPSFLWGNRRLGTQAVAGCYLLARVRGSETGYRRHDSAQSEAVSSRWRFVMLRLFSNHLLDREGRAPVIERRIAPRFEPSPRSAMWRCRRWSKRASRRPVHREQPDTSPPHIIRSLRPRWPPIAFLAPLRFLHTVQIRSRCPVLAQTPAPVTKIERI